MKISIPLHSTSMQSDEFMEDAHNAVDFLTGRLNNFFDESFSANVSFPQSGILSKAIWINIIGAPVGSSNLDKLNAKLILKFVMHLADGSGNLRDKDKFEIELMQISSAAKKAGIKFRKVSGKSPMEASKKFVEWIKKNELAIKGTR